MILTQHLVQGIIVIIILLIIIYFLFLSDKSQNTSPERFDMTENQFYNLDHKTTLDDYYTPISHQLSTIDNAICSPDCCGTQWPMSDGLTVEDIKSQMSNMNNKNNIGTNYTCTNGNNGRGCPCLTPESYSMLTNRGVSESKKYANNNLTNHLSGHLTDNTNNGMTKYLINHAKDHVSGLANYLLNSPRQELKDLVPFGMTSPYTNNRLINDLIYRKNPDNLDNVQSYGSIN
ncbi:hypothetical protein [Powai lake megavirus]|uniref:Uncharacterized protein n=1 Tax=Powai lake megavirus TaxID=1842663 RepID=A0A167REG9_9VIRU|nr:hypothetical protein QJ849_gp430 [Powai lake megavirus]ANB50592.1 hypothetical protein [Powai lake megavirus]